MKLSPDQIREWNPYGYNELMENSLQKDLGFFGWYRKFAKADDPLLTSTTGVLQEFYGKTVWDWINREANTFAVLPKKPWTKSGWRVITADPSSIISGVTETGSIPDTVQPTWAALKTSFKQMITAIEYSRKMALLSKTGDDTISLDEYRNWAANAHKLGLDQALLEDAESTAGSLSANYAGKDLLESIDRIISNDAEEDDVGGSYDHAFDPWKKYGSTIDRDTGTTYDAVVVHGDGTVTFQGGNPDFTTDATFNLDAVDALVYQTRKNGANPRNQVFITGWDTYRRWKQLVEPKERFFNPVKVQLTVNGVQTERGVEAGITLSSYNDIPIIVDHNCPKDTISRIYLLDLETLFIKVVTPTTYLTPEQTSQYLAKDKLTEEYWFLTEAETICTRFKTQGKLRSLK